MPPWFWFFQFFFGGVSWAAFSGFSALGVPSRRCVAGLLSGRFLGIYTAVVAALLLIVLDLVAGQAAVPVLSDDLSLSKGEVEGGGVTIGDDQDPLMASEEMATAAEAKLMPPQAYDDPWLVDTIREAVREGNVGHILVWLYLMMHWWGPVCLIGSALTFLALGPRLLTPHLVDLVGLWTTVASAVAWACPVVRQAHQPRSRKGG